MKPPLRPEVQPRNLRQLFRKTSVLYYLSQFASDANYASLVVGFPELEFSSNEVYAWPKSEEAVK